MQAELNDAPVAQTSRLCVKNIPKYVDEKRLREHFSAKGDITDIKLLRRKDGASRCFAFVGFKTVDQAAQSFKYFNKSFMDTCRLVVEFAESFKTRDTQEHRPWSKYSDGSSAHKHLEAAEKGDTASDREADTKKKKKKGDKMLSKVDEKAQNDKKLSEFLDIMKPRSLAKSYANDEVVPEGALPAAAPDRQRASRRTARDSDNDSDDDDYQDLTQLGMAAPDMGRAGAAKTRRLRPVGDESDSDDGAAHEAGSDSDSGRDEAIMNDDISDMDYLKRRMRASIAAESSDDDENAPSGARLNGSDAESSGDEEGGTAARGRGKKAAAPVHDAAASGGDNTADGEGDTDSEDDRESDQEGSAQGTAEAADRSPPGESSGRQHAAFSEDPEALIQQTGRLFIRNLPFVTTDDDILAACAAHGAVEDAHIVRDRASEKSKGYALVTFRAPADAVAAFRALDGAIFQGRLIHVLPGKRPTVREPAEEGPDGAAASFKAQREQQRRADAGNRSAWSTFYMRPDTVAEAVAELLGITKAELLDPQASDAAVRLALGETQVAAATKEDLEREGVSVAALEAAAAASGSAAATAHVARSPTALLLKNLPWAATAREISELFEKFGGAARVVLPSTRTLAIVEMPDPDSARRAFKGLAYKRFHHVPLYLEWAPRDVFDDAPSRGAPPAAAAPPADAPATGTAATVLTGLAEAEAADESVESVSLFVKNVSFGTSEDTLKRHFDKSASAVGGRLRAVRIVKAKRPDGKLVSRGFAFAEFSDHSTARAVLRRCQASLVDGHKLELQLSSQKDGAQGAAGTSKAVKRKPGPGVSETKVLVRNLAFEATAKDVRGLLEAFGQVKTCRLPQKFDGSKRGFAFVEFSSKADAKKAVAAVHGTHLYGRRLLLEYATEEEGLDELRAKTAAAFGKEGGSAKKKARTSGLGLDVAP